VKKVQPSEPGVRVAKGTFIILIDYIIVNVFGIIYGISIGRLLGPNGYGIVATAMAFFNIFVYLASFGIPPSIVRFVSKYVALKKLDTVRRFLIISFKYLLIFALALSATLIIFAGPIATNVYHDPKLTVALRMAGLMVLPGVFLPGFLSAFQGFQRMKYHLFTESFYAIARVPLALVFIFAGYYATGAIAGTLAGLSLACVLGFFLLLRLLPKGEQKVIKSHDISKEIISFSIPNWLTSIAGVVLLSYGTIWLGYVVKLQEVGYYSSALLIASLLPGIAGATSTALFPAISGLWTLGDKENFASSVRLSIKFIFTLLIPLVVGTAIFSEFILRLIFGTNFIAGGQVLRILSVAVLPMSMNSLNVTILAGIGRPGICAKIYLIAVILAVAVITPLAWFYGIVGAAVGFLMAQIVIFCLTTIFVKKLTGLAHTLQVLWKPAVAACVMLVPILLLRLVTTNLIEAIFIGVFGFLVYAFAFIKLGGVEKSDVALLRQISSDMGEPRILDIAVRFLDAHAK